MDDILLHDQSIGDMFWYMYQLLSACAENRITLRPDKLRFQRRSVTFVGYLLNWEDYHPSQDLISIRLWFMLVNQVAPLLSVPPLMEPFQELLKSFRVRWSTGMASYSPSSRPPRRPSASSRLRGFSSMTSHGLQQCSQISVGLASALLSCINTASVCHKRLHCVTRGAESWHSVVVVT